MSALEIFGWIATSIAGYFNYASWRFWNDQTDALDLKLILLIPVATWAVLQFCITLRILL